MRKEIFGVKAPEKECTDRKCPFHGEINVKKELLRGKVIKKDISGSATIEWEKTTYVPKYERYQVSRSRLRVHNPTCVDAQIGDVVVVARTRPLSKVKNHVILGQVVDKKEVKEKSKEN